MRILCVDFTCGMFVMCHMRILCVHFTCVMFVIFREDSVGFSHEACLSSGMRILCVHFTCVMFVIFHEDSVGFFTCGMFILCHEDSVCTSHMWHVYCFFINIWYRSYEQNTVRWVKYCRIFLMDCYLVLYGIPGEVWYGVFISVFFNFKLLFCPQTTHHLWKYAFCYRSLVIGCQIFLWEK